MHIQIFWCQEKNAIKLANCPQRGKFETMLCHKYLEADPWTTRCSEESPDTP